MNKIKVANPIVEIDGDEMARIMWQFIKDKLIKPYLEIDLRRFDLGLESRDRSGDRITILAAQAIKQYRVGIKCATITPNSDRQKEFNLKQIWKSPNGTIRNILGGTVFRQPIVCSNIPRYVTSWRQPIVIARHAFGDIYKATDFIVPAAGTLSIKWTPAQGDGQPIEHKIFDFPSSGVALGMYNLDESIRGFAHSCFNYALKQGYPVYLGTKSTILQTYDRRFVDLFEETYQQHYRQVFQERNLSYTHRLIDDMVAAALKLEGGFLWACKNYDGDVLSDIVAQGFGSLGLMSSVLLTPDGQIVETEAAHGTVTRHYREHQQGRETSTNPIASIFAWSQGLGYRARFDDTPEVEEFANLLERACIQTVEAGYMTKDLALLRGPEQKWLTTTQFIDRLAQVLEQSLGRT